MSKNTCRCSKPDWDYWERSNFIGCRYTVVDRTHRWLRGVTIYYCVRCGHFWLEKIEEDDSLTLMTGAGTGWTLLEGEPVCWKEMRKRKHEQIPDREDGKTFFKYGNNVTIKQYDDFAFIVIFEKAQEAYENAVKKGRFVLSKETWNADMPAISTGKRVDI